MRRNQLEVAGPVPALQGLEHTVGGAVEAPANTATAALAPTRRAQSLGDVQAREMPRIASGIEEFDRVLGGGLVEGGVVLIGGDPGIGKSTLLLQSLAALSTHAAVLYVSGEESAAQVALRARRLGVDAARRCGCCRRSRSSASSRPSAPRSRRSW